MIADQSHQPNSQGNTQIQEQHQKASQVSETPVEVQQKDKKKRQQRKKKSSTNDQEGSQPKQQQRKQQKSQQKNGGQSQSANTPKPTSDESSSQTKKRKQKEETKQTAADLKKIDQQKVSAPQAEHSKDKYENERQSSTSQDALMTESWKQSNQASSKKGRPQKEESKDSETKKEEAPLPEKVREWKERKEEFEAILKDLIEKGVQARQNPPKSALQVEDCQSQIDSCKDYRQELLQELESLRNEMGDSRSVVLRETTKLAILKLIAPIIDSSFLNLDKLAQSCKELLRNQLSGSPTSDLIELINLNELICSNAERKSNGVKPKTAILYEDESSEALWCWEISNIMLLSPQQQRELPAIRQQRTALSSKVKSIDKLLSLLDKSKQEKDVAKIVEEFDKYNKVLRKENAMIQKELQKQQALKGKDQKEQLLKEQKEKEREQREQERLQKEQEKMDKLKEKEELKEKERLEKLEKQRAKDQERLEKKRKMDEQALKTEQAQPSKVQKVNVQPVDIHNITSFFTKGDRVTSKVNAQSLLAPVQSINSEVQAEQAAKQTMFKKGPSIETEAFKVQLDFKKRFKEDLDKRPPYSKSTLVEAMDIFKKAEQFYSCQEQKKKCIYIEDSYIKYFGVFDKQSFVVCPRNPLKKDETVIDYEMSSEEEWNEVNGEDLDGKQEDEEEDKEDKDDEVMEEGEAYEGFIVPDDYLSASELNLSQSQNSQIEQHLEERRKQLPRRVNEAPNAQLQPFALVFQKQTDKKVLSYMEEFKAITFPKDKPFPLKLQRREEIELGLAGEGADKMTGSGQKQNPNAINEKLHELVTLMHGSFESKVKVIEDFNIQYPECSKKSIEKKFRDLFVKEKRANDPRARWYATESTLADLNLVDDQRLKELSQERLNVVLEEVSKQKEELDKLKEEKKQQNQLIKEHEKEQKLKEKELSMTPVNTKKQPACNADVPAVEERVSQDARKVSASLTLPEGNQSDQLRLLSDDSEQSKKDVKLQGSSKGSKPVPIIQAQAPQTAKILQFFKKQTPEEIEQERLKRAEVVQKQRDIVQPPKKVIEEQKSSPSKAQTSPSKQKHSKPGRPKGSKKAESSSTEKQLRPNGVSKKQKGKPKKAELGSSKESPQKGKKNSKKSSESQADPKQSGQSQNSAAKESEVPMEVN